MSPEQVRAARGWLDWSQADLADKAHVGLSTVKDYENGNRKPIANNLGAMRRALESGGVAFENAPDGQPLGIRVNSAEK